MKHKNGVTHVTYREGYEVLRVAGQQIDYTMARLDVLQKEARVVSPVNVVTMLMLMMTMVVVVGVVVVVVVTQ